jgi:dephospho-CoA kinase
MPLIILTGASGSGKTAIAEAIESTRPGFADVLRFDRIGVPSPEAMLTGWGSGEAWQRATTFDWLARIATLRTLSRPALFEGQMRLVFVREGLLSAGIADARVVLVDCDDKTRTHRLLTHRNQSELATPTMMNWAAFLRREARDGGYEVLDTTNISLETGVEHVRALLRGEGRERSLVGPQSFDPVSP